MQTTTAPTGMLKPRGDNAVHSTAAVYSAESPGIKTHTYLPSYTHNIFHLPPHTSTSSTWAGSPFSSYLHTLHLHLQAVTWPPWAGGGCQAANSGKPYMEDHPPLPNASPLLLQTCKLPKTARTAQNCAKTWSVCKPAKERSSLLLHNLPYARACPSVLIKPPPSSPPDFLFTCHTSLFLPSLHTSRESLSCSRSIESQPCATMWEIFHRETNRVVVCHMLDIALHRVSCAF